MVIFLYDIHIFDYIEKCPEMVIIFYGHFSI